MCGRFALTHTDDDVRAFLSLGKLGVFVERYNIAPTQPILTVGLSAQGERAPELVRWGLIPQWVADPENFTLIINARSETAATKPSFKSAMRHRRILIPASGFYEWHRPDDKTQPKQAYWIRPNHGGLICFAGLAETWMGKDGTEIDTGCILTTQSNAQIGNIHHRMPVIIPPEEFDRWLDCKTQEPRDVADLLAPAADGFFDATPVGDAVNKVANTGPDIQEPGEAQPPQPAKRPAKPSKDDNQFELF